jgi:hypothetical protein
MDARRVALVSGGRAVGRGHLHQARSTGLPCGGDPFTTNAKSAVAPGHIVSAVTFSRLCDVANWESRCCVREDSTPWSVDVLVNNAGSRAM